MGAASDSGNIQHPRSNQQESREPAPPPHRWEWSLVIFNGLLVIIGTLQVWTYMASERAMITVEPVAVPLIIDVPIVAKFQIRNSGRTTAFITDAIINLHIGKSLPEVPQYKTGDPTFIKGPIVAGSSRPTTLKIQTENGVSIRLDEVTASKINDGTVNLYIHGFITYQTQFRILRAFFPKAFSHDTGFCHIWDRTDKSWQYCREEAYIYGD